MLTMSSHLVNSATRVLSKKFKVVECELTSHNATVYGRKIPLLDIRQKLWEKHEQYMYLHSDYQLTTFTDEELLHQLEKENTDT